MKTMAELHKLRVLAQENHLMILCSFFFVIVFLVPFTFIAYYQNSRNFAVNGVPPTSRFPISGAKTLQDDAIHAESGHS